MRSVMAGLALALLSLPASAQESGVTGKKKDFHRGTLLAIHSNTEPPKLSLFLDTINGRLQLTGPQTRGLDDPQEHTQRLVEAFNGAEMVLYGKADPSAHELELNTTRLMVQGVIYQDKDGLWLRLPSGIAVHVEGPASYDEATSLGHLVWVEGDISTGNLKARKISSPVYEGIWGEPILPNPFWGPPFHPLFPHQRVDPYNFPGSRIERIANTKTPAGECCDGPKDVVLHGFDREKT